MTVTDLLQNATYDQIVLSLCFGAVVVSGTMMHLSAHLGNRTRARRVDAVENGRAKHLKLQPAPETESATREKAA